MIGADPFTQQPFQGGQNVMAGFKAVLKVLNRYNLVTVLDLSKYSSVCAVRLCMCCAHHTGVHQVLLRDAVGWEENREVHFHEKSSVKEEMFYEQMLHGCVPQERTLPVWKDRYPLRGCVDKAVWDWWNEAAYLGACFL
jgi:hypothetical protein